MWTFTVLKSSCIGCVEMQFEHTVYSMLNDSPPLVIKKKKAFPCNWSYLCFFIWIFLFKGLLSLFHVLLICFSYYFAWIYFCFFWNLSYYLFFWLWFRISPSLHQSTMICFQRVLRMIHQGIPVDSNLLLLVKSWGWGFGTQLIWAYFWGLITSLLFCIPCTYMSFKICGYQFFAFIVCAVKQFEWWICTCRDGRNQKTQNAETSFGCALSSYR